MTDELIFPGGGFFHKGEEYYIAKVHPEDAYHKYNLVGCRFRLRNAMQYNYVYSFPEKAGSGHAMTMADNKLYDDYPSSVIPFYYLAIGELLDGPLAGEEVSFWRVMLSKDFPFYTVMQEAIDG